MMFITWSYYRYCYNILNTVWEVVMLKRILVPLDGSALAETALPYAQQIIEDGGEITLLMIDDHTPILMGDATFFISSTESAVAQQEEALLKHAEDYLARITTQLAGSKLKIESMVVKGSPADEIVDIAKSMPIDAIVMSTHGRTGLSRWLLGSVTQKVLGVAPCPVFVIPGETTE